MDGLLPHEISHLILRDFIGEGVKIPIWFDEGVAQLNEGDKGKEAHGYLKRFMEAHQPIPIDILHEWDIRQEKDEDKVAVFYAQSVSMVDFLIKKYGSTVFGRLCRNLREKKSMDEALRVASSNAIGSLKDFETKWLTYMKNHK